MSAVRTQIGLCYRHAEARKVADLVAREVMKGCSPDLSHCPLRLEPPHEAVFSPYPTPLLTLTDSTVEQLADQESRVRRFRVWIPPDYGLSWTRSERFLKELAAVSERVGFEVIGNCEGVTICLTCHPRDVCTIGAAFQEFTRCTLSALPVDPIADFGTDEMWGACQFLDYYPPPPYSHLLTQPGELVCSPYEGFIACLGRLPSYVKGFCQVLFQPVCPEHDWHRNIERLLDIEFRSRLLENTSTPDRFLQQAPSACLPDMAADVQTKAHQDKPFFACALRTGLLPVSGDAPLRALSSFTGLLQHGTRPLKCLVRSDYGFLRSGRDVQAMFAVGHTYRHGFLLNSRELASLVHVVSPRAWEKTGITMATLETLPAARPELLDAAKGTPVGICVCGDDEQTVCLPEAVRACHTHVIGKTGMGKSTTLEWMILDDIAKGHGVAVLDPHGDMVQRLLCLVPEEHASRVIYLNPGDPDWVPLWNPLVRHPGQDIAVTADCLVGVFKHIVDGWGDRLERLLREAIFGAMHLPDPTLLDVAEMLRKGTVEGDRLRKRVMSLIQNTETQRFWSSDFGKYTKADLFPPQHKIGKLLSGGTVGDMMAQPESRLDLPRIMDDSSVLLCDLSALGSETRDLLGSFLLALFHVAALGRQRIPPPKRKLFHIYCDEAHRFVTDAVEDLVAETRKYAVSLTLAHQFRKQFSDRRIDALSGTGSTLIFSVNKADAACLAKELMDKVTVADLVSLGVGRAVVRIGTEVVRITTRDYQALPERHWRDEIIRRSHELYCRPVQEVRAAIRQRSARWETRYTDLSSGGGRGEGRAEEEFRFDEFGK